MKRLQIIIAVLLFTTNTFSQVTQQKKDSVKAMRFEKYWDAHQFPLPVCICHNDYTVFDSVCFEKCMAKNRLIVQGLKKQDSIYFYNNLSEDWAVNGKDTSYWLLYSPFPKKYIIPELDENGHDSKWNYWTKDVRSFSETRGFKEGLVMRGLNVSKTKNK